jgi:hypothetical protein
MAERVRVIVKGSHGGNLSVRDAMEQVLDFFRLLSLSGDDDSVEWRLVSASTNSPLTVEAEAVGAAPDVDVETVARAQKVTLAKDFRAVLRGERPQAWPEKSQRHTLAANLMRRTLNGVSETEIDLETDAQTPLIWTTEAARTAIIALENRPAFEHDFRQHAERGAVEGSLWSGNAYYGRPAIWIRDRHGNNIPCRISEELQEQITHDLNFADVWQHRRVVASGRVFYGDGGRINRVDADSVSLLLPGKDVSLDKLFDSNFTGGLTPSEYLDRLREGDLG